MKSRYALHSDDVVSSTETATDNVWRSHRIERSQLAIDIVIATAAFCLLIAFGLFEDVPVAEAEKLRSQLQQLPPYAAAHAQGRAVHQSDALGER